MAANKSPIFSATPHVGSVIIPQADAVAKSTGTSSAESPEIMYCVFKAGLNGSYLSKVRFMVCSDTADTASTATCLRVFLSTAAQTEGSASGATTSTNTSLVAEIAVPAITSDRTATAVTPFEVVLGFPIPAGMSVLVCQHVAMANACNWRAVCVGGDY